MYNEKELHNHPFLCWVDKEKFLVPRKYGCFLRVSFHLREITVHSSYSYFKFRFLLKKKKVLFSLKIFVPAFKVVLYGED